MPDAIPGPVLEGGVRFGSDLRRIRLSREVTLEKVYESTRVSTYILEQLESNVLDHPLFNNAYLRPLLQQIARILDVDPDEVIQAYDRACKGQYTNQLAVMYLDEEPASIETSSEPVSEMEVEPAAPEAVPSSSSHSEEDEASSGPTRKRTPLWATVGMAMVSTLCLAWFGLSAIALEGGEQFAADAQEPVHMSTMTTGFELSPVVERNLIPQQVEEPTPEPRSDSIRVDVVAAHDKVDPIRVRVDDDLRRPYWIEKSDSMTFFIRDRIVVEERLERVQLLIEGMVFPFEVASSEDAVTITREQALSFLEQQPQAQLAVGRDEDHLSGV